MTAIATEIEGRIRACDNFQQAANAVLDILKGCCDLPLWVVTAVQGDDWVPLAARDEAFDVDAGDVLSWRSTICTRMVEKKGPQIAPDVSAVPAYADAPLAKRMNIGCYIGLPYFGPDGELFGTVCGLDHVPHEVDMRRLAPMLAAVSSALTTFLTLENEREQAQDKIQELEQRQRRDPLTGLVNRMGWERAIDTAQDRITHSNGAAGVALVKLAGLHDINMSQGYAAGDERLQACAEVLEHSTRRTDHVARLSGCEFGVLLTGTFPQALSDKVADIESGLRERDLDVAIGWAWSGVLGDLTDTWRSADKLLHARSTG